MSDFSSPLPVNGGNSGCESDSDFERPKESTTKTKNRKKRKVLQQQQQQRDPAMIINHPTDDETESQLNYEETPDNSTPYSSPVTLHYHEKMRRRLQFFFMNPVEKWQAKRR